MSKVVKGFSLIEPLVSVIIISAILSVALFTINNLTTNSITSHIKTKAWIIVQEYHKRTLSEKAFWSEKEEFGQFIIERKVNKYKNYSHLLQLNYTVYSIKNKKVLAFKTIADEVMEK